MKKSSRASKATELSSQVQATRSYIDSIFIRLPKLMEKKSFLELRRALVSERRVSRVRYVFKKVRVPDTTYFHLKLAVHQPSRKATEIISEYLVACRAAARVLEVHVALDFLVGSYSGAEEAMRSFLELFLPTSRPSRPLEWVADSTAYYNKGVNRGTGYAIYCDRPSKVTKTPCLHVECRVKGGQQLERSQVRFLDQLLILDHRDFWAKRLQLCAPPTPERIDKELAKCVAKYKEISNPSTGTGRSVIRSSLGPSGRVLAHDTFFHLLSLRSLTRPRRLFYDVSTEWALPPSENAIWKTP
jgi:hypothetical protein